LKDNNRVKRAFLAFILMLAMTLAYMPVSMTAYAQDADGTHYIAVATDRHSDEDAIGRTFAGMPLDIDYICLAGDMVDRGVFNTSDILAQLRGVFYRDESGNERLTKDNVSILYGYTHDRSANDDAGIMYGKNAGDSGLIYTGYDENGEPAYYIYEIAFYDMSSGVAQENCGAADEFIRWIKEEAQAAVPIIVVCHMPMHYMRGDNGYAIAWNKALNYAATGIEDLTEEGAKIKRNVIFLHGHNHSVENNSEYYVPAGSIMQIFDEYGYTCNYYTYTTAGYMRDNRSATLIAIDDNITISKYQYGEVRSTYRDEGYKTDFSDTYATDAVHVFRNLSKKQVDPFAQQGKPFTIAKMTAEGESQFNIEWTAVDGADGYSVYMAKCDHKSGNKNKLSRVMTVEDGDVTSWLTPEDLVISGKGIKARTGYRMRVKAYTLVDGQKEYICSSPIVHAFTSGYSGSYYNPKSVSLKSKDKITIKKGKTSTVKASAIRLRKSKKLIPGSHAAAVRYISNNPKIAKVSSKGKITAVKTGKCYIYAYTVNGTYKKIRVTVK